MTATANFTELVDEMRRLFGDDSVNIEEVENVLHGYKSKRKEWAKYAIFDERHYTRNLVDTGNGKYNMIILCWGPGMCTNVHDHSGSHCFVKMLQGELMETRFHFPAPEDDGEVKPLRKIEEITFGENQVTYINDSIGLHRMENPSHTEPAISLHIYSPAYDECFLFDQRTSQKHVSKVTFWSKFGTVERTGPFDPITRPGRPH